jgi:hypothetical protein
MNHRIVESNRIKMHIAEDGEGPLVILSQRLSGAVVLVAAPIEGIG